MKICFDLETTGLNFLKDRITAIGLKTDNGERLITYKSEKRLLQEFWAYLRQKKKFCLVGFNSRGFDIPMLVTRSFIHNVPVIDIRGKHIDLRDCFNNNRYAKGRLEEYSQAIGYQPKYNGFKGEDIPLLWQEGRIPELKEYLAQDVRMTYAVYQRLKVIGWIA